MDAALDADWLDKMVDRLIKELEKQLTAILADLQRLIDAEHERLESLAAADVVSAGQGEVLTVGADIGRHVSAGDTIASVVDCDKRFVVAIFSYRQGESMKPGTRVRIEGGSLRQGVVSAVLHARETGEGQFLDVAMVDAVLGVSERIVHQYSFGHEVPGPEGNHHPFLLPFGVYPAADGFVALACPSDAFFRGLVEALGAPDVLDEPRFATPKDRAANRAGVIALLSALTASLTKAELHQRLGGVVPFGPVLTIAEIAEDPHFAARGMLAPIEIDGLPGPLRVAGQPIKFAGTPAGVRGRAPNLGQDTAAVLREHGASADDIARWRAAGAILEDTP